MLHILADAVRDHYVVAATIHLICADRSVDQYLAVTALRKQALAACCHLAKAFQKLFALEDFSAGRYRCVKLIQTRETLLSVDACSAHCLDSHYC